VSPIAIHATEALKAVEPPLGRRHFDAPQVASCEVPPATTQTGWRSAVLQMQ